MKVTINNGKMKVPTGIKLAAFTVGGWISKLDADTVASILVFILKVAKVIIKATPSKADDAVLSVAEPIVTQIAEILDGMDDD